MNGQNAAKNVATARIVFLHHLPFIAYHILQIITVDSLQCQIIEQVILRFRIIVRLNLPRLFIEIILLHLITFDLDHPLKGKSLT